MDIVSYAMGDGAGYKRGYADGQEGQSPVQRDIDDIANYPILHVGDAYLLERNESFRIRENDVFTTSISDPRYYHGLSLLHYGNSFTAYDVITNVYDDDGTIRLTRDKYDNIVTDNDFIAIIVNNTLYYYKLNAYKTYIDYTSRGDINFEDYNDIIDFINISGVPFILTDIDDQIIRVDSNYFDIDSETYVKGSIIGSRTRCKIYKPVIVVGDEKNLVYDYSGYPLKADSITNMYDGIGPFSRFYDVKLIQTPNYQTYLWFNMINTV